MAEFSLHGRRSEVRITRFSPQLTVSVDGRAYEMQPLASDAPDMFHMQIGEKTMAGICCEDQDKVYLRCRGRTYALEKHELLPVAAGSSADGEIRAELPGNLVSVHCAVGDKVAAGDLLLIMTSMKMEVPVHASRGGKIDAVLVAPGQAFERGTPLVRMELEP